MFDIGQRWQTARGPLYLVLATLCLLSPQTGLGGMPAPIPVFEGPAETAASETDSASATWAVERHLGALSFFVACVLGLAVIIKACWNALRRDLPMLPQLGYGRSLSLVALWGLMFVIVLTMISGARELMTPGAWRKQGWTYVLSDPVPSVTGNQTDAAHARRAGLERLRSELLMRAALDEGRFPSVERGELPVGTDPTLWNLPGWPGLKYLYVDGQRVEEAGRLLVFEPQVDEGDRLVLLTNGAIASMSTADIQRALAALQAVEVAAP